MAIKKGNTAVFGIFDSRPEVESAIDLLRSEGYRSSDISVLMAEPQGTSEMAHEKGTKAPEGAAVGVAGGAVVGGAFGWLAGIGSLAIPGIGPFLAAGPLMAALAGATVGGAIGGVSGALIGMGVPEYEAKRFESLISEGGILLSVHADDSEWADQAKALLKRCGARDIASSREEDIRRPQLNVPPADPRLPFDYRP